MDDSKLEDYNFDEKVGCWENVQIEPKKYFWKIAEFVNYTKLQTESYATSNLIMTMGKINIALTKRIYKITQVKTLTMETPICGLKIWISCETISTTT